MKRKNKKISISGNYFFVYYRIALGIILIASLVFSIEDRVCGIIHWPVGYDNIVGVSSQIITAIITLVISIIGIAISLQNEEFFGVKITKLYALRVSKHDSILAIIIISIFLCVFNLVFYMLGLIIAAIGTLIVSFLFLLQVVCAEVPIMSKQENAFLHILKDNLIMCYSNKTEASKDLKDSIKYLLWTKNMKEMYSYFKDDFDEEFNQFVILKFLEFQHDLAFELKDIYNENEQRIITSSLLENVYDIMLRNVEISDELYSKISNNRHLLTRVLFCIYDFPSVQNRFLDKFRELFLYLSFSSSDCEVEENLISDVIITLTARTVKKGDLSILKAIRCQLSSLQYYLTQASPALNIFAVLSMYLYYLSHSDLDVPIKIKKDIEIFISEGNIIENSTKIASWKDLFSRAAINFEVDYNKFVVVTMRNSNSLEYYLFGNEAKLVILDQLYLSQWYLTHMLNTRRACKMDFSRLVNEYPNIKAYLVNFGDSCLDENKTFVPTTRMNQIVEFYGQETEYFEYFKFFEERNHEFFNFINRLKYDKLKTDSYHAANINNAKFASKIRDHIEEFIQNEWGFDSNLEIDNTDRYFALLFEKTLDAVNFEESIIGYCVSSIQADLKKNVQKTVVCNDDHFETNIQEILLKKPKYVTVDAKEIIPNSYIKDKQLKQEYISACKLLEEFQSNILGEFVIVIKDGFHFNCKIERVEFRELTREELSKQVIKHQRADGQFVFNGVFLPQEEIIKIIKAKYTVLTIFFRHQINSSKQAIFELKPYLKGLED